MKLNKRTLAAGTLSAAIALGLTTYATVAHAQTKLTVQSEKAAHPRLVAAIHEMEAALHELEAAPHDFGGNKAAAMEDTRHAIHSLKKALYFRLKMDDAAIDRAQ